MTLKRVAIDGLYSFKSFRSPFSKAPWANPFLTKFIQETLLLWYAFSPENELLAVGIAVILPLLMKKFQSYWLGVETSDKITSRLDDVEQLIERVRNIVGDNLHITDKSEKWEQELNKVLLLEEPTDGSANNNTDTDDNIGITPRR